jgi:hypothetical protein
MRFDLWEFAAHNFRVETRDLNGEAAMEAISGTLKVNGAGNATAVSHLVFSISNLRFKCEGVLNFVLYVDNKEITSMPLYIRNTPAG